MENNAHKNTIKICLGSSCYARGNADSLKIIQQFVEDRGINATLDFRGHLCKESCNVGPVITINDKTYEGIEPSKVEALLKQTLI